MFQAVSPPIIRSSKLTHSIWYMSGLLAATASGTLRLGLPGFWNLSMILCYKHNTFRQLDILLFSDKKLGLATCWALSDVLMSSTGPNPPIFFVMFDRPSVHLSARNNPAPTGRIFVKLIFEHFSKNLSRKFKFRSNRSKWRVRYILYHIWLNSWNRKCFKVVEKFKSHIFCSKTLPPPPSRIVGFVRQCGTILYSRTVHSWQYGARALHAGYLRLQTHTLGIYNTSCFSTETMVVRTRLVKRYTYIVCLLY
jgi:hypothetical protein